MFNTGNLGRWLPDGTLEHLGRVDDQVMIRVRYIYTLLDKHHLTENGIGLICQARQSSCCDGGMTLQFVSRRLILLNALKQTCPAVKAAAALLIESELWGFVTPASLNVGNIIAATAKTQPYYAVPQRVLALSKFQISRFVPPFPKPFHLFITSP
jgi:hypothetical protein